MSRVAGLDGLPEEQVRKSLGEPTTTPVLLPTSSGERVPHSKSTAPQYLVEPVKWDGIESGDNHGFHSHSHEHRQEHKRLSSTFVVPSACLIDFHESFMVNNLPEDLGIPQQYCSPEYIFDKEIGYGTDLWALGCTLFEIRTGRVLFQAPNDDLDDYLCSVVEMLGKLPEPWWSRTWEERPAFFDDAADKKGKAIKARRLLSPIRGGAFLESRHHSIQDAISDGLVCDQDGGQGYQAISDEEVGLFTDLLKKLLRYSPEDRITAEDALDHPWFKL